MLIWQNPLEFAYSISTDKNYQENWIFLYSGLDGKTSYLALYPKKEIIADDFKKLENELKKNNKLWFGYLGYGLKNSLENLPKDQKSLVNLPNLWMINFNLVLEFDHVNQQIISHFSDAKFLQKIPIPKKITSKLLAKISDLKSNFSKKQYLKKVEIIKNKITDGEFYQANLTRKFYGKFKLISGNVFDLFIKLNKTSPANYSAFLKLGENHIISSSPELFLSIENNGQIISSPIKGTAPRSLNKKIDLLNKNNLKKDLKERSENLMIVDLVRNDLSRNCLIGSVEVKNLFKISSYKTVHHMSSDICGIKNKESSALDVIKSCFPPGSMTGAPKIKAMEICSKLEKNSRGIYSGAIGFLSRDICNLSVVIRTILIRKDFLEFQVGGAITFDSNPINEWQETMEKATGISKALGIRLADLKKR